MTGVNVCQDLEGNYHKPKSGSFITRTLKLARDIFDAQPEVKLSALLLLAVMALTNCKFDDLARIEAQVSYTLWSYLRTCQSRGPREQVSESTVLRRHTC